MKIQTIMYRDLFEIEMKPKFCNEIRLASKLCSPHYPQIIFSHYLYHIIIFSAKHHHCSYIVLIGIIKTLRGDKLKKSSKKGVLKENNCGKFWIFFAGLLLVAQAKSVIAMKKAVSNVKDKLTTHKQRVMDNSTHQSSISFGQRRYIYKN